MKKIIRNIFTILFIFLFTCINAQEVFDTVQDAMLAFGRDNNEDSITSDKELGAFIHDNGNGGFILGDTFEGGQHNISNSQMNAGLDSSLGPIAGFGHTHGRDSPGFNDNALSGVPWETGGDIGTANRLNIPVSATTPDGSTHIFNPDDPNNIKHFPDSAPSEEDVDSSEGGDYKETGDD